MFHIDTRYRYTLLFVLPIDTPSKDREELLKQLHWHAGLTSYVTSTRQDKLLYSFPFKAKGPDHDFAHDIDNVAFEGEWYVFEGYLTTSEILERFRVEGLT